MRPDDLAALIRAVPPQTTIKRYGPDREQRALLDLLMSGQITIGECISQYETIEAAFKACEKPGSYSATGKNLCIKLERIKPAASPDDVPGW